MVTFNLRYHLSIDLLYEGKCSLLGISPDLKLYVEELYDDDHAIAQHILNLDGATVDTIDEDYGRQTIAPFQLPEASIRVAGAKQTKHLEYGGARLRGLRMTERIDQLTRPLTIESKMQIVDQLELDMPPPMLIGVAESYVLAEAQITAPDEFVVCRRVRIAYALPEAKMDEDNQPYDYDTITLQIAHPYDIKHDAPLPPEDAFAGLPEVSLHHPTDCIYAHGYVIVSDGGGEHYKNRIHIWQTQT